jgi:hypothetical protein
MLGTRVGKMWSVTYLFKKEKYDGRDSHESYCIHDAG